MDDLDVGMFYTGENEGRRRSLQKVMCGHFFLSLQDTP